MDFKRTRIFIGALAVLASASVALADDPVAFPECTKTPSSDDVEAAKQSHLIATSRFNLQDWDKAIEFWRQAYGLDCTAHALLVNIANAYEKKGDKRSAVAALETYLTRATGAPDLVKINERVVDLKKELQPEPVASASASAPASSASASATETPPPPPPGPRPFGVTPLVIAGAGTVLAIAGAIMIPAGLGPYNEALAECSGRDAEGNLTCAGAADPKASEAKGNTGRAVWNTGAALLGVGLVAAAGGLVFQFVFNKPAPAASAPPGRAPGAQVNVAPLVSPELGGLVLHGKF